MTLDDFWGNTAPGLLNAGIGYYNSMSAQDEAKKRLAAAQGPLYTNAMGAANGILGQVNTGSPDAVAADYFGKQQALVNPVQSKNLDDLIRSLYAKGMLGVANYNPGVAGITPNGTAMNPAIAAFYAAQNADNSQRAANALTAGQTYQGNQISQASNLQGLAGNTQRTGMNGVGALPSAATANAGLLSGIANTVLKNPDILKSIFNGVSGLFGGGGDSFLGGYMPGDNFAW